ncbi:MAG TPA: helix-turn-helix domain-containing protein [Gemmatimonadales bacterium]|nr:helix-turn-helix domain-containing protein [Gemmatimonadales bacterium]
MDETSLGAVLRRLREERGLTLRAIAERSGFSASFLSQVENEQASPSISSMERIAAALGVTLGEFFQTVEQGNQVRVVRANARQNLYSQWSKARIESLASGEPNRKLQAVLVTLKPDGSSGRQPYPAPSEEFALVLKGSVVLTTDNHEQVLNEGDGVTVHAGTMRRWHNRGTAATQIVIVAAR